ncbi:aldose 1-epimerase family protein [Fusobacterium sp.]|uniref:aldose 1-epimerase family protein n=1 Tax=Fusobacterium sp. TaxID=68766 RepID=UPI0029013B7B|nr:aldose 1-epimerase family protein [Fusobacterium sp.]MDU1910580.1 aldose 1-epimerase family protein [Fusobacterium sp.]
MEYSLRNNLMEIRIESLGAELVGMKDLITDMEYIWQKDPKYWAKSSPILFPFVGALKDSRYFYEGKEYNLSLKHGFARDCEFQMSGQGDNYLEFLLTSNDKTKKVYPFDFKLYVKYIIKDKNLRIEYKIENTGGKEMYFSLGAHPAFNIPIGKEIEFSDYYLEFEKEETGEVNTFNGTLISSQKKIKAFEGKILNLDRNTFANDALIIENPNSNVVYLKNRKNSRGIKLVYKGFKYIAFWNKPGAEYICLEPWNGISDFDNASGDLKEKIGIEKIKKAEVYHRALDITIL